MTERNKREYGGGGIGVYVCQCGTNIAGMIDCAEVAAFGATLPGVKISREYKYMCSDPGQEMIKQDIRDLGLDRIVVASCSPHLHEKTFRDATSGGGLNPYFFQMVNIREHGSWVHTDGASATEKAKDLVRAAVRRVAMHKPLEARRVPIKEGVMVVGAGIAGIHAALTLANAGKHVYLVEREPTIGGHMAMFDKTFPTLDCAACILTPKMTATRSRSRSTPASSSTTCAWAARSASMPACTRRERSRMSSTWASACGSRSTCPSRRPCPRW
jgi:heterodisulfide reductase subunit A